MAAIYLQHPIHGSKVACSDWEAAYDEQHGWERYDPTETADESPMEIVSALESVVRPKRKYTRRATTAAVPDPDEA